MLWLLFALLSPAFAWYLPGMAPTDYNDGDPVPVLVNRLTSQNPGRERTVLAYDFYHPHFRFCQPEGGPKSRPGSLGAVLFGDRVFTSAIEFEMLKEESCKHICTTTYRRQDAEFVARRIVLGFYQHWLVDGLPVSGYNGTSWYSNVGFPLGEISDTTYEIDEVELFNHYEFTVDYHHAPTGYRIVGVSVKPTSRNNVKGSGRCDVTEPVRLVNDAVNDVQVTFTYSVQWVASDTPWATRWDRYLQINDAQVNWFALVNTTIVVFLLIALASLSLMRLLRKDIARYNELDLSSEDIPDENGWKMVSGDVFRPPRHRMLFSLMVGCGAQVLVTVVATLFLALLGFLSPANRGSFATVLLLLNSIFGGLGGYLSATTYKSWGGDRWKVNLLLTPVVLPLILFGLFFTLNMLLIMHEASGAVPIGSIVLLLLIWFLIGIPLSIVSGLVAFKRPTPAAPVRVNQIPRQIPPTPWYLSVTGCMALGGLIPFLALALQLHYILTAIWFDRLYYMFGFLFASFAAMVLLSGACAALSLYLSLNCEDHHWQWRAFFVAGSPAIYIFLYACYYLSRYMNLHFLSGRLLYLGYSLMGSMLCFIALGSVGVMVCEPLVRKIYTSIKVD